MIDDATLRTFQRYVVNTPARLQSTRGWTNYLKANAGSPGAYDAALRQHKTLPSFEQMYAISRLGPKGETTLALDDASGFARRSGNVVAMNGEQAPEVMEDAEPPISGEIRGRAPPWGPDDVPTNRSVTEPNPNIATDPYTPAQERAFGAAAGGRGELGIDPDFARRALHEGKDQAEVELPSEERHSAQSVRAGQQGVDQEHEDEPQDEKLIRRVLTKLGFKGSDIDDAIARDRAGRRRMAGDERPRGSAASFARMYGPDAVRLMPSIPAQSPRVFIHKSRG